VFTKSLTLEKTKKNTLISFLVQLLKIVIEGYDSTEIITSFISNVKHTFGSIEKVFSH
jgi:hypothetical protein